MSLLKLNAKVILKSEEMMESEDSRDFGVIASSNSWVWRNIAVPFEEVYKIVEYSPNKTIVHLYDEEKILVKEKFEDVYEKWDALRILYADFSKNVNEEGEETSKDEDE